MLKKMSLLIDRESGEEWRVDARTHGASVPGADGKPSRLYVYVLQNKFLHKRFVYEHRWEEEFLLKS